MVSHQSFTETNYALLSILLPIYHDLLATAICCYDPLTFFWSLLSTSNKLPMLHTLCGSYRNLWLGSSTLMWPSAVTVPEMNAKLPASRLIDLNHMFNGFMWPVARRMQPVSKFLAILRCCVYFVLVGDEAAHWTAVRIKRCTVESWSGLRELYSWAALV